MKKFTKKEIKEIYVLNKLNQLEMQHNVGWGSGEFIRNTKKFLKECRKDLTPAEISVLDKKAERKLYFYHPELKKAPQLSGIK